MPDDAQITQEMLRALEIVRADPDILIVDELKLLPSGEAEFRCTVPVHPFPNAQELPERARLRVRLDSAFPFHDVEIYTEDDPGLRGFPHQDAETGKLCLFPERQAPWTPQRVKTYLDWAREWLSDAATNNLLRPGEPFELPDFSRRAIGEKLPTQLPLLIDESAESFAFWTDRIGTAGSVDLAPAKTLRGLLVKRFYDGEDVMIREWSYSEILADPKKRIAGTWILLPSLVYVRHRPPQTFGELGDMCREYGIKLLDMIRIAWEERNKEPEMAFVLVGSPMPARVGEPDCEVHWQPLFLRNSRSEHRDRKKRHDHERGNYTNGRMWNSLMNESALAGNTILPWGRTENVARQRLYARGQHKAISAKKKIVIAGCGALGGITAEMVVRGGAHDVCLVDKDVFEVGNQCRHTLDGSSVRLGKATSLAERLQSINPLTALAGYAVALPPSHDDEEREKVVKAIEGADVIIDCTTDEGAFRWLDRIARRTGARLASIYVNFRATIITLCISGRTTSCSRVYRRLNADVYESKTPVTAKEYGGKLDPGELVLPGPGCWHPTFPGTNADMWMMAAVAVKALNQLLEEPVMTDGTAVLFRRNEKDALATPLEVVWNEKYR